MNSLLNRLAAGLCCLVILAVSGCGNRGFSDQSTGNAEHLIRTDRYTLIAPLNLYHGYEPLDSLGRVSVVVEIPAGTSEKWEVKKESGNLEWDFSNGQPRVIRYLSYPANYGMIPRTLLPKELSGDGDPLDVIVLGPAVPRGTVLKTRLVGMLRMRDGGEQDDKLIAVMEGSAFGSVQSLEELEELFPGVISILDTWFSNYKGYGVMELQETADADEAQQVLQAAIDAYRAQSTQSGH